MMSRKRKICFVITSQIHYARSRKLLEELQKHPGIELQIAVAASAILPQYGDVLTEMKDDGFRCSAKIVMTLAGGNPVAMAKTTGIGVTEFATAFDNLEPDIVVVRGDRYEILAAAIAAAYMNIPVAQIEAGDVSGTIDESVRHAVTKLAHIHFTTNEDAQKRVLLMGENPASTFLVGCPELEELDRHSKPLRSEDINAQGVGNPINLEKPFLVVMYHPVTTETDNREMTDLVLKVVHSLDIPTIWFWPNVDAGTDDVAKAIRVFREHEPTDHMHFLKYLPAETFTALLKKCACLVGNSSAGIKEASYIGVPVVNIGTRQHGRMRGPNVIDTSYDAKDISNAIERQVEHGRYEKSTVYARPDCIKRIVETLATINVSSQKTFFEQE